MRGSSRSSAAASARAPATLVNARSRGKALAAHLDGVDAEAAEVPGEPHAHELGEDCKHDLIAEVDEGLVVVHLLDEDHAVAVRGVDGDVVRDCGEHLLLERPWARVEGNTRAAEGETPVGQDGLEELAARVEEDLDDLAAETCAQSY
jgi:hypothetical protein